MTNNSPEDAHPTDDDPRLIGDILSSTPPEQLLDSEAYTSRKPENSVMDRSNELTELVVERAELQAARRSGQQIDPRRILDILRALAQTEKELDDAGGYEPTKDALS